jgi:hypothetical protein
MARSRKPLIEPGSVLPPSDTLSRILERDRSRSGRRAPSDVLEAVPAEEHAADMPYAHITSNIPPQADAQAAALASGQPPAQTDGSKALQQHAQPGILQDAHITALHDSLAVAQQPAQPAAQTDAPLHTQATAQSAALPDVQGTAQAAGQPGVQAAPQAPVQPATPAAGQTGGYPAIREVPVQQPTGQTSPAPIAGSSGGSVQPAGAAVQQRAAQLAATRLIPITLRLPEGLNDWLDDYAHEHRKEGIKKQDLISRAVQLLVMEAEGGRG